MFFLNLSLPEFLAIAGALSGLITALYFFDRSKRKKTVSTLRFWTGAQAAERQKRRKSVSQPWSLLLQLLSILLLLLAMARLQWGLRIAETKNTVLLLDTSSAAGAARGQGTVLDAEKALARQYVARVNPRERVMLARVDALAAPATPFTTDRQQLRSAIDASTASYSALSIQRALEYARQAANRSAGMPGEVVYIGPKKVTEAFAGGLPGLRVLAVPGAEQNCGVRGITVTRSEGEEAWRAAVLLRNDGSETRVLELLASFGTTSFAPRKLSIRPKEEATVSYQFVANSAGRLTVRLQPGDSLPSDDEASVMLPASRPAKVVVYTAREEAWRPLLMEDKSLGVVYQQPQQYRPHPDADVVILDRFAPRARPEVPSLWVDPPVDGSAVPVKAAVANQVVTQWNTDRELGAGLHARDVMLPLAKVFQTFDRDFVAASIGRGPVAVVRPASDAGEKLAAVGFDFVGEPLRFTVTSPILFANLMRWLAPQAFRAVQVSAEPVGLGSVTLDNSEQAGGVQVADGNGRAIPFLAQGNRVQFFVETPAVIRVATRQRERIVSMVLPEIATAEWNVPAEVPRSMPGLSSGGALAMDLWPVLACLGGVGLLVEWLIFGQHRLGKFRPRGASREREPRRERERELVSK